MTMSGFLQGEFSGRTIATARIALWSLAALLLAAPWVAMRFTNEVRWDAMDFLVFGVMLAVAGGLVEGVVWRSRRRRVVLGALLVVGMAFLLTWAELAVGILNGS
jgi:cytochrome bd-type quinol oxidase subunit 2